MNEDLDCLIVVKSGYLSDSEDEREEYEEYSKLAIINLILECQDISLNFRNVTRYSKYRRKRLLGILRGLV